jgi:quercetin dioxygenase-like cupin family protein
MELGRTVIVGNAVDDGAGNNRGWFVGHFITPSDDLRHTEAVEVKWGVHPAGDARPTVAPGLETTTVSILVSGAFRVSFPGREVRLARPGDYLLFPPDVPHTWVAEADSVVITVRWPSRPDSMGAPPMAEDRHV